MIKYLLVVGFLLPFAVSGQQVRGTVINEKGEALVGASVYWLGTTTGTTTGDAGDFEFSLNDAQGDQLVVSYIGYMSDTLSVFTRSAMMITLFETNTLREVVVKEQRDGVIISDLNPIKTEQITQTELRKSSCCDLAGCFETQTTVQPQTTNVITNSKELRILGLSGVYNQVLIDGFPMVQGLSYTYGISGIPGTLVDNIYISKGANSVIQGYESISGQINVETIKPDKTDRLYLNLYLNSFLETHVNANYAFQKNKWSNVTAFHTVQPAQRTDRDGDHFMDLPLLTRYMVFNKWKYGSDTEKGWNTQMGLRYLHENRIGGQETFNDETDRGSTEVYGQTVDINQPEIWTKTGYRVDNKQQIVLYASALHQKQKSFFGTVAYDAKQTMVYTNIQYELDYHVAHDLKAGLSYRYLDIDENIAFSENLLNRTYAGNYHRTDRIPGLFVENIMRLFDDKLTWIIGLRGDHHDEFGFKTSPRTLIKYDVAPQTVVRANFGSGWRIVNLFSENIGLLVSSRDIIFAEELLPEEALNYGVNLTQKFNTINESLTGYFSTDFYRTDFKNQFFPDYNTDPQKAIIENFTGKSISNGFQAELYVEIHDRYEIKTGYNYLDVYHEVEGVKQTLPFNSKHKVLATFGYKPLTKKFHFDMNIHWYGKQRLPDTKSNPVEYQRPDFSDPYTVVNAQYTHRFKNFEVYAGCENLFDFRQKQPILGWQNPFDPYFDTSSVWGPTRGREGYIGIRFKLSE